MEGRNWLDEMDGALGGRAIHSRAPGLALLLNRGGMVIQNMDVNLGQLAV